MEAVFESFRNKNESEQLDIAVTNYMLPGNYAGYQMNELQIWVNVKLRKQTANIPGMSVVLQKNTNQIQDGWTANCRSL